MRKSDWLLAAATLIAVLCAVLVLRDDPTKRIVEPTTLQPLFSPTQQMQADRIVISAPDEELAWAYLRSETGVWIGEGVTNEPLAQSINIAVVSLLSAAYGDALGVLQNDAAVFGLTPAQLEITLYQGTVQLAQIRVGNQTSVQGGHYIVAPNGSDIVIATITQLDVLLR